MDVVGRFEAMLASGKDSPLMRYGLGLEYLKRKDYTRAVEHLGRAVAADPGHTAAWKQYGNALAAAGEPARAARAYESGISVADERGDMQAAKEMRVFLRRVRKSLPHTGSGHRE